MRMKLSNVRKRIREPPKCDKRTITCDVGTAQCVDEIVKCEKKIKRTIKCNKELPAA